MRAGSIVAEHVAREFRVNAQRLTLKEAIVRHRRLRGQEIVALRDVSFRVEPGEAVGLVGRNGSGKTTLLRMIAGIFSPTSGRLEVGGSVGSLLALGAGFHPELTGRENVELSGAIHGLTRRYVRERFDEIVHFAELEHAIDLPVRTYSSGMFMRLGFSIATHLSADVLLLDEVFAVGDEAFQRKCFGKVFEFKSRGGTIVFVSHSAPAVESLCERAILLRDGVVDFDGSSHEAIVRYQGQLAAEEDPAERGAGLREWGTGEAQIVGVRLEDGEGRERLQVLSGEPVVVRFTVTNAAPLDDPLLVLELRDRTSAILGAATVAAGDIGWDGAAGRHEVSFAIDRVPLTDGRFMLCAAVTDTTGTRVLHRVDEAARFVVVPDAAAPRGTLRLDGTWALADSTVGAAG